MGEKVRFRTKAQRHKVAQRKNISRRAHRGTEKKLRFRAKAQRHKVAQRDFFLAVVGVENFSH